jgi:hypothetical protein
MGGRAAPTHGSRNRHQEPAPRKKHFDASMPTEIGAPNASGSATIKTSSEPRWSHTFRVRTSSLRVVARDKEGGNKGKWKRRRRINAQAGGM